MRGAGRLPLKRPSIRAAKEDNIRRIARTRPHLILALLALTMLAVAGCIGFNNPEGWAGPTAADDVLVVSTSKGKLSALSAEDFASVWRFPTGDEDPEIDLEAIYTTPPVIGGTVYLGAYSGDVYALSLEDGSVRWSFDAEAPVIAGLEVSETAVYVATDAGILYALDAEDGSEIWRFDAGDSIWAAPLLADGDLYVASVNGKLFKMNAETFEPVWDAPYETGHGLISDPVLADGTVLIGGIDRKLHAVDASSGEERWSFKGGNWFWGRPLVEDGTVYAPNLDGRLHAIDLETGEEIWSFEAEEPDPLRSAPALAAGVLVIVDRGGNVYGLDPENGMEQWSKELEKTVLSDPLVLTEEGEEGEDVEKVLISAQGGDLFSVDPAAGTFIEVPTP